MHCAEESSILTGRRRNSNNEVSSQDTAKFLQFMPHVCEVLLLTPAHTLAVVAQVYNPRHQKEDAEGFEVQDQLALQTRLAYVCFV